MQGLDEPQAASGSVDRPNLSVTRTLTPSRVAPVLASSGSGAIDRPKLTVTRSHPPSRLAPTLASLESGSRSGSVDRPKLTVARTLTPSRLAPVLAPSCTKSKSFGDHPSSSWEGAASTLPAGQSARSGRRAQTVVRDPCEA